MGIAFILNFAITKHPFAHFTLEVYGLIVLKAIIVLLCIFTWVKGIKHVPASIADPFTYLRMLGLLVVSWLLMGDKVDLTSIILTFTVSVSCVSIGIFQAKTEKLSQNVKNYAKGMMWLVAWMAASILNITTFKHIAKTGVNFVTMIFFEQATYAALSLIVLVFFIARQKQGIVRPLLHSFDQVIRDPWLIGIGSTYLGDLLYIPLLLVLNMGVLDAIMSVNMVLVVLISTIFYKEKIHPLVYPFIVIIVGCSIALSLLAT
jgi:drug/metabolite transporter (DMT)-like permease